VGSIGPMRSFLVSISSDRKMNPPMGNAMIASIKRTAGGNQRKWAITRTCTTKLRKYKTPLYAQNNVGIANRSTNDESSLSLRLITGQTGRYPRWCFQAGQRSTTIYHIYLWVTGVRRRRVRKKTKSTRAAVITLKVPGSGVETGAPSTKLKM